MFSKTLDGHEINWFDLNPKLITVERIARVLSRINRYSGHWRKPVSVARHSVMVSRSLANYPVEMQLAGLFHDASEAYTQDIPSPLKAQLMVSDDTIGGVGVMNYDEFERAMLERIFGVLQLQWPIPNAVWEEDARAYEIEQPIIRGETRLHTVDPEVDEMLFLARYAELRKGLRNATVPSDTVGIDLIEGPKVVGI